MLAALVVVYTFNFIDRQILSILLQPIKADLGLTDTAMGFLTGFAFAIFYATLGIPIAMLADRWNRRSILAISLGLWSAMTALSGLVTNFWQLAAARVGVGIGEAGGSPPAYSLISDYFPPQERATALAIYSMGLPLGILCGFLIGGWVNDWFGWRAAFFIVGIPGLLFALVVRFGIREPVRGAFETAAVEPAPPLREAIRAIWGHGALRHAILGTMAVAFANYGFLTWTPAFLIRSHGLAVSTVGTYSALVIGISGAVGMLLAGRAADALARRDVRWLAWLPALIVLVNLPGAVLTLTAPTPLMTFVWMAIPSAMGVMYLGPVLALLQNFTAPRMRAVAGAFFLFVVNLVGLGLGPQVVGILSDLLAPALGTDSLRYGIIAAAFANLLAAWHYRQAARAMAPAP